MPSEAGEIKNIVDAIRHGLQLASVKVAQSSTGIANIGSFTVSASPAEFTIDNTTEYDTTVNGPLISTITVQSLNDYSGTVMLSSNPANFMGGCAGKFNVAFVSEAVQISSVELDANGTAVFQAIISIGAGGCSPTLPSSPLVIQIWGTDQTTQEAEKATITITVNSGDIQKGCKHDSDCGNGLICCCGKCYSQELCTPASTDAGAQNCVDKGIASGTGCTNCSPTLNCPGNNPICGYYEGIINKGGKGTPVGHCIVVQGSDCGVPFDLNPVSPTGGADTSDMGCGDTANEATYSGGKITKRMCVTANASGTLSMSIKQHGTTCDCCSDLVPDPSSQTVSPGVTYCFAMTMTVGCVQKSCYAYEVTFTYTGKGQGRTITYSKSCAIHFCFTACTSINAKAWFIPAFNTSGKLQIVQYKKLPGGLCDTSVAELVAECGAVYPNYCGAEFPADRCMQYFMCAPVGGTMLFQDSTQSMVNHQCITNISQTCYPGSPPAATDYSTLFDAPLNFGANPGCPCKIAAPCTCAGAP